MKEGKPHRLGDGAASVIKSCYIVSNPNSQICFEMFDFCFFPQVWRKLIPQYSSSEHKAVPVEHKVRVLHDDVLVIVLPGQDGRQVLWFPGLPDPENSF